MERVAERVGARLDVIVEGGQLQREAAAVVPLAAAAGRPGGQLRAVRLRYTPASVRQFNYTSYITTILCNDAATVKHQEAHR